MNSTLMKMLSELDDNTPDSDPFKGNMEARIDTMREYWSKMQEKNEFKVGDIVTWKDGLRNKKTDYPLLVVEVFDAPIFDLSKGAGSPYFREPLDIMCAEVDGDGDFFLHHYDSRRFEHWRG